MNEVPTSPTSPPAADSPTWGVAPASFKLIGQEAVMLFRRSTPQPIHDLGDTAPPLAAAKVGFLASEVVAAYNAARQELVETQRLTEEAAVAAMRAEELVTDAAGKGGEAIDQADGELTIAIAKHRRLARRVGILYEHASKCWQDVQRAADAAARAAGDAVHSQAVADLAALQAEIAASVSPLLERAEKIMHAQRHAERFRFSLSAGDVQPPPPRPPKIAERELQPAVV